MASGGEEPIWQHDVFLSFRGEETRETFAGNLYDALRHNRFRVFTDDSGIKSGDHISAATFDAIENSRIAIVVLSPRFAYSTWCLDELDLILRCQKEKNQLVCPIFYNVDPSDVRRLRGSYGESMAALEQRLQSNTEKVQKWKHALAEVCSLSGWVFRSGDQYEYKFIQSIVEWATGILPRCNVFLSFSDVDTRRSFTGYLYNALCQAGIQTFMKVETPEEGEDQISPSLINAIENSRLSIIVLSENYAYSSCCLDQLVKILDCMETKNQVVWPIFYKVKPSDLRHQRNSYGIAMAAHENDSSIDPVKVQKWRSALTQVANLQGCPFEAGYEYKFIERIVESAVRI